MPLRLLTLFLAALSLATVAGAATEVAPGVDLIPGHFVPNAQPDGNTVVFRGPKGLIVVDTGRHPEHTQAIVDFAKAQHAPVVAIINTHWHLDHIGGNPFLRREFPGVRVYASGALADAQKGFLAKYRAQLEEMIAKTADAEEQRPWRAELAIIDAGPALAPDEIVTKSGKRSIGGRALLLHLESHAVTAGDVWVFDPATRVLASGDLVTVPAPFLDTACPDRWKTALDHLAATDFEILVPGHGAPMHRKEFEAYRTAYDNLLSCSASAKVKKECIDGWMTDAGSLIASEDPRFVRSLVDYYIDNSLRGDPAVEARLCGR